jgi:electron transport complex protein RnfD
MRASELMLPPRPLLRGGLPASRMRGRLLLALIPVVLGGIIAWGFNALLLLVASCAGALLAELFSKKLLGNLLRLKDGSALTTGVILALTLPPALDPRWAFAGAFLGVVLGKEIFGGIGRNPLNPALVGRVLLALIAPLAMEQGMRAPFAWKGDWQATGSGPEAAGLLASLKEAAAVLHQALSGSEISLPAGWPPLAERLDVIRHARELLELVTPSEIVIRTLPGLLGEFSLLALLPGLIWLLASRVVDWRIPLPAILLTPVLFLLARGELVWLTPMLSLNACMFLLVIVVLAADPVTSPLGHMAKVVYGLLLALLLFATHLLGLGSGSFFLAVLICNLLTPWLDWLLLPRGPGYSGSPS